MQLFVRPFMTNGVLRSYVRTNKVLCITTHNFHFSVPCHVRITKYGLETSCELLHQTTQGEMTRICIKKYPNKLKSPQTPVVSLVSRFGLMVTKEGFEMRYHSHPSTRHHIVLLLPSSFPSTHVKQFCL